MTQRERLRHLLDRECDGELTQVEAEELARGLWLEPELRREREVWRRLEGAASTSSPPPRLSTEGMAQRIVLALDQRPEVRPMARRASWGWALAAASLAAAVMLFVRVGEAPNPIHPPPNPPALVVAKKPRAHAPVEVDLGDPTAQREVEIRF